MSRCIRVTISECFVSSQTRHHVIEWVHGGGKMTVGENIRRLRKEKRITQKKLSELTGIAEVTIRKYESGKFTPKIPQVERIARGLQVHPSEILGIDYWDSSLNVQQIADEAGTLDSVSASFGESAVQLLSSFLSLNDKGKQKAVEYIADLTEQPKYQK